MGGAASTSQAVSEVWPPDWENMAESSRKIARSAILSLSALPPDEFLAIGQAAHAIPRESWRFEEYHAAAAAAVQEDIKLNKIIYRLVPRKCEESEFWRLYFSQARAPRGTLNPVKYRHCCSSLRAICLIAHRSYSCSNQSKGTVNTRRRRRPRRQTEEESRARNPVRSRRSLPKTPTASATRALSCDRERAARGGAGGITILLKKG